MSTIQLSLWKQRPLCMIARKKKLIKEGRRKNLEMVTGWPLMIKLLS